MEEIILRERELRDTIVQIINKANLPAFIIKPIIKELYEQIIMLEDKQYELAQEKVHNMEEKEEKENG